MSGLAKDVWVTGIGLVSSLGEGTAAHWAHLNDAKSGVNIEADRFAPYPVHPLAAVDFGKQIPKKSDQRQMEAWQRVGVYAAGLALDDAKIARDPKFLSRTILVVAAGSGERDTNVDAKVLESISTSADTAVLAKEILPTALRPTLFLAQLSNLLAGNISIIHAVTGSSRTFMGEEMAGLSAIENAARRIAAGQGDLFLVGGALNAEREDLLLNYELGCNVWAHPFKPVWERRAAGGGFVPGSVGAFLVLESKEHALARGAKPYASIKTVLSDHTLRRPGEARDMLSGLFEKAMTGSKPGPLAVLSGASGVEPVTSEEREALDALSAKGCTVSTRAYGSAFGHSVEAHFPLGIALASMALANKAFYPPFESSSVEQPFEGAPERVVVTGLGHWRGEGLAVLERVDERETA
jgi:3-oxoacyl-[acyl-carrier-protein] synthase II